MASRTTFPPARHEGGDAAPAALSHRDVLIVFSGLMLGLLLAALDQTIVATALPVIVGDLHGLSHISWVVTAYLLTSTAVTPLYGKISDLYGRKLVFQAAIVIFLVGSALSGLSQNMIELIAFRALQGVGGGGLMVLAMAIVGDVVSPRERGRYQGYFGVVFAAASVGGPLLGGFFTDQISWRWIFYINLPVGLLALAVTSAVLKLPVHRVRHRIDYLGSGLLMAAVTAVLLVTVWGGSTYRWGSPVIWGLVVGAVVCVVAFVECEKRASEPIVPLRLFSNRIFSVTSAMALLLGFVMFGAIIYLPEYFQIVDGTSATASGLRLIAMTLAVVAASIGSGQAITRTGRYKAFPIAGMAISLVGFWLLSHLGVHTGLVAVSLWMAVLGFGIGLTMQVLVLAVQNGVDYKDLGTATSAVSFTRTLGGAIGAAFVGAIMTNKVISDLRSLPGGTHGAAQQLLAGNPAQLGALPRHVHEVVISAFAGAFHLSYLWVLPFVAAALLLALVLPEAPLRLVTKGRGAQAPARGGEPAQSSDADAGFGFAEPF